MRGSHLSEAAPWRWGRGSCRAADAPVTLEASLVSCSSLTSFRHRFRYHRLFHSFPSTRDEEAPVPTSSSPLLQSETIPRLQEDRTAAAAKLTSAGSAGAAATPRPGLQSCRASGHHPGERAGGKGEGREAGRTAGQVGGDLR